MERGLLLLLLPMLALAGVAAASSGMGTLYVSGEDPRGDVQIVSYTGFVPPTGSIDWVYSEVYYNVSARSLYGIVKLGDELYTGGIWYTVELDTTYYIDTTPWRYLFTVMFYSGEDGISIQHFALTAETPAGHMLVPSQNEFRVEGDTLYFSAILPEEFVIPEADEVGWTLYVTVVANDGPQPGAPQAFMSVDEGETNNIIIIGETTTTNTFVTTQSPTMDHGGTTTTTTQQPAPTATGTTVEDRDVLEEADGSQTMLAAAALAGIAVLGGVAWKLLSR